MNTFSRERSWGKKFANAFRGIAIALQDGGSFWVHLPAAIGVLGIAAVIGIDVVRWCLLLLCIAIVLAAELFNSGLEALAQAITDQHNEHVKDALDIASGGVLCVVMFAVLIGVLILGPPLITVLLG